MVRPHNPLVNVRQGAVRRALTRARQSLTRAASFDKGETKSDKGVDVTWQMEPAGYKDPPASPHLSPPHQLASIQTHNPFFKQPPNKQTQSTCLDADVPVPAPAAAARAALAMVVQYVSSSLWNSGARSLTSTSTNKCSNRLNNIHPTTV
jgi:hypothetical protein